MTARDNIVLIFASIIEELRRASDYLCVHLKKKKRVEYSLITSSSLSLEEREGKENLRIYKYVGAELPGSQEDITHYRLNPYSSYSWKKTAKRIFKVAHDKTITYGLISQSDGLLTVFASCVIGLLNHFENCCIQNALILSDPPVPAPICQEGLPQSTKKRRMIKMASLGGESMQTLSNKIGDTVYDYTAQLEERGVLKKRSEDGGRECILLPKGQIWSALLEIDEENEKAEV